MDLEKRVEMLEKRIDKLESEKMKEKLTGLKVGDYFEVAGTKWRILDIKPCGYVCLSDVLEESRTFDSETNNWKQVVCVNISITIFIRKLLMRLWKKIFFRLEEIYYLLMDRMNMEIARIMYLFFLLTITDNTES